MQDTSCALKLITEGRKEKREVQFRQLSFFAERGQMQQVRKGRGAIARDALQVQLEQLISVGQRRLG